MSESSTVRERVVDDLWSIQTLVILVAIVLAMAITYTATREMTVGGAFLLVVSIGVFVPDVYRRYWPVEYPAAGAVVWTIAASLVTAGVFLGSAAVFVSSLTATSAAVAAFLLTSVVQFGSGFAYRRLREEP